MIHARAHTYIHKYIHKNKHLYIHTQNKQTNILQPQIFVCAQIFHTHNKHTYTQICVREITHIYTNNTRARAHTHTHTHTQTNKQKYVRTQKQTNIHTQNKQTYIHTYTPANIKTYFKLYDPIEAGGCGVTNTLSRPKIRCLLTPLHHNSDNISLVLDIMMSWWVPIRFPISVITY